MIIPISDLNPGIQLADDVLSPQGMLVAKKGDTISEKHLKSFKAWGVTEVNIQAEDSAGQENDLAKAFDTLSNLELIEEIDYFFSKTNRDHPVIAELYAIAIQITSGA